MNVPWSLSNLFLSFIGLHRGYEIYKASCHKGIIYINIDHQNIASRVPVFVV